MKPEEAKKYLKNFVGDGSMEFVIGPIKTEALISAIDALEKQVPKTGKWNYSDDMYESGVCSVCKWDTGEPYVNCKKWFKFCPNCGSYNGGENEM